MWEPGQLWTFLPLGYALTIAIEIPVLLIGLSPSHTWRQRILAGFALTAFTYPIVILVLPLLLGNYDEWVYVTVAEIFAPLAECLLFWLAVGGDLRSRSTWRDFAAIVVANVASFLCGEFIFSVLF